MDPLNDSQLKEVAKSLTSKQAAQEILNNFLPLLQSRLQSTIDNLKHPCIDFLSKALLPEPTLCDDKKELAVATLRSIALNYIERKGPRPPKTLVRSNNQLRKRDDIVIRKPDKGSGVVVMNKSDYVRLLSEASINDETKFKSVSLERPKTKGRPPKHYHPLLEREKHLDSVVRRILPKHIADTVCQKGSRLAHLYGRPKTHKERLAMRPILSATGTYNYALAKNGLMRN